MQTVPDLEVSSSADMKNSWARAITRPCFTKHYRNKAGLDWITGSVRKKYRIDEEKTRM